MWVADQMSRRPESQLSTREYSQSQQVSLVAQDSQDFAPMVYQYSSQRPSTEASTRTIAQSRFETNLVHKVSPEAALSCRGYMSKLRRQQ